ncbi:MAG: hypothetical protein LBG92_04490 [Prevotellaceae bacterium]|jgi:hypothetical protein|nr:hypothetical protein [Prevotellaceae bacterium]
MKEKKNIFVLFIALATVSCGDVYKESTGADFSGTWSLVQSTRYEFDSISGDMTSVNMNVDGGTFLIARKLQENDILLFYSRGTYDSSFLYQIGDNGIDILVKRIYDLEAVMVTCENCPPIIDKNGKVDSLHMWDSLHLKPLEPPVTDNDVLYDYYGTIAEFQTGILASMTIVRYKTELDKKGKTAINRNSIAYKDVYERPLNENE